MMAFSFSSSSFSFLLLLFFLSCVSHGTSHIKGIDLENPALDVTPKTLSGDSSFRGSKSILCDRVRVLGHSRLKLGSYASSFQVTLTPSVYIPERLHGKIQVCFHRNASLGLCKCENDDWKVVQKGIWHTVMSPYDDRYIDVKFTGDVSGYVTVAVVEDFQQWRLLFLALGFVLLLLAPFVSSWVPFYYSSSMAIGVFLVIIILLFQLGAGSFLLHQLSAFVNSILVTFGLSEEMHNPVAIFVLVGIILAGAALGYWIVRKYVISKDGSVDVHVAHFVKWAMNIIASTFIFQELKNSKLDFWLAGYRFSRWNWKPDFEMDLAFCDSMTLPFPLTAKAKSYYWLISTLDPLLAMAALASFSAICYLIISAKRSGCRKQMHSGNESPWLHRPRQGIVKHGRAEFLSRSPTMNSNQKAWNAPKTSPAWNNSPVKGVVSSALDDTAVDHQDFYSTFHKAHNRKKFTKQEWEDFSRESTRNAMAELAASPDFTDWIIEHADRIKLLPCDSSDESVGSKSSSTDDDAEGSHSRFKLFSW
ncbi:hypothetical protein COLO4_28629 [Corchorus olitorius]|uniref:Uncharacterized protein n=1 Tax=Corchorus olitorius TaxID=93759 RepID=A0A1R3HJ35_9ROSI|nr:hypothetical protein COLO4_28629 [Corchorus olitorius]